MYFRARSLLVREVKRLCRDECGVTMVEYGLMVAFVSVAILVTFISIGETLRDDVFTPLSNAMQSGATQAETN